MYRSGFIITIWFLITHFTQSGHAYHKSNKKSFVCFAFYNIFVWVKLTVSLFDSNNLIL